MKRISQLTIVAAVLLSAACTQSRRPTDVEAPYTEDWDALSAHNEAPEWFRDAKVGIYFHWGVYSVPAYGNEWYPRNMHFPDGDVGAHHLETYGHPSVFGYHDFIPQFTAEHFDPGEWADLFQQAGARFAGPVAEHHDGYSMWHSEVTPWNVMDTGPKRDITVEMAAALRERGMKLITTFHHASNLQGYDSLPEGHFSNHRQFLEIQYTSADIRYTTSKDGQVVYAIILGVPVEGKEITMKAFGSGTNGGPAAVTDVALLGVLAKSPTGQSMNEGCTS